MRVATSQMFRSAENPRGSLTVILASASPLAMWPVSSGPLLCGLAKAKYYLLTCKPLSGEEAERIGLVSLYVEDADLQNVALETALDFVNGAQSAIRWTKYALNNWLRVSGPLFDTSTALEMLGFAGPEAREGLASHLDKRKPSFPKDCPI